MNVHGNANQITLARARHFGIHLFIISVRSGTRQCIIRISVYCFHFPLDHCFQKTWPWPRPRESWQLASASASHYVALASTAHGLVNKPGTMWAVFHSSGRIPVLYDWLNINESGFARTVAHSFNRSGCMLSGPGYSSVFNRWPQDSKP